MSKTVLIIAGEASGDKHAANLVESLKRREDVRLIGIGGEKMQAAGVELLHHAKEMSVMGFSEIFSKLPFLRRVRKDLMSSVRTEKPSAVILVDYPGFNLRFAGLAKRNGIKVIYFISPQIWAWGKRRIKKIRRTVDLMLTIFKFEEDMYREEGVNARFVGHPLLDEIRTHDKSELESFRKSCSVDENGKMLVLFPGSRLQEVKRILPTMLESAELLKEELLKIGTRLEAVIGCASGIDQSVYEQIVREAGVSVRFSRDPDLLMSAGDAGLIKSGTATLEAALHGLPIAVVYRTSWINYFIGRMLVKLDSISLVNIVAGKKIVEELIQNDFTSTRAASIMKEIITNKNVVDEIRAKYAELRTVIGEKGASDRAAELVLETI